MKSERIDRLDKACCKLYEQLGVNFTVQQLAAEARVSNSIAGPHKREWLGRRVRGSSITDEPAPLEDSTPVVNALIELAVQANNNVSALIDTVNKLVAVLEQRTSPGEPRAENWSKATGAPEDTPSLLCESPPPQAAKSTERTSENKTKPGPPRIHTASEAQTADCKATASQMAPPAHREQFADATLVPIEAAADFLEGGLIATEGKLTAHPLQKRDVSSQDCRHDSTTPAVDTRPPLPGGNDSARTISPALVPSPQRRVNGRHKGSDQSSPIDFDLNSNRPLRQNSRHRQFRDPSLSTAPEFGARQTESENAELIELGSFAYVEEIAEDVLLKAKQPLPARQIYQGLPSSVRRRYSARYFGTLLRSSQRLYHNSGYFYPKLRAKEGQASEGIPLHIAATGVTADLLRDVDRPLFAIEIYPNLPSALKNRISEEALQPMLVAGSAELPLIEMTNFGEWRPIGSSASQERRRDSRDSLPSFKREVNKILTTNNHPMLGVEIFDELSPDLKRSFARDRMTRHLKKVRGIFQYTRDSGPHLRSKWWITAKRILKPASSASDIEPSRRADTMAYQRRVTEYAETVIVHGAGDMNVQSILAEVRKRFEVDDETRLVRALNSRRKAAKSRIVRVAPGTYRARPVHSG
ncbi:hypothetical protein LPW26_14335 [Rhodopseudomonas sp. HC1]|uniref:hypothetical protein n=1 Tax=Rhodopseudomonas infernalis TaxID=2897386 RepID=UPI001EE89C9D|nr:hypothetical protein [Rhodopseudomonas infernalis]MCG6205826.1 hypothetical protein [Rhodopseudomonas infernalis]